MVRRRVLLLSPLPGLDPPNGDVTYTQQLLQHPPADVEYVPYDQALADGSLIELYRRGSARSRPRDTALLVREATANRARRSGLMFREPFRHFRIREHHFDVVHAHVFSVALANADTPLVVSNSVPIDALYIDGFGTRPATVRLQRLLDRRLAALTGVSHSSFGQVGAERVICFSAHLRNWFIRHGGDPRRYVVVPPSVPTVSVRDRRTPGGPPVIGFIGHFEAKGGPAVLEAHRALRHEGLDVSLTVVGSEPRLSAAESSELNVTWLPRQPQERLLTEIIPTFTVFAYPSRFDGLPLTLLEVMAAGVPAIVSDYGALPEVVDFGRAGTVVRQNDPIGLARGIRELLDPETRRTVAGATQAQIHDHFSPQRNAAKLAQVYADAVSRREGSWV
jgi:glycosyltransferase involved in cell wall biosynthesis